MKTIIHVVDMAARRERIFEALTTVDGLAAWWTTTVSGDAGPDGLVGFTFDGQVFHPDMRVTEQSPPSLVGWRCVGGVDQWADNTFSFELVPHDAGTRLRFRQNYAAELSDDEYGIYNYNWGYYLESLRLLCTTGTGKPFHPGATS
jgi:uncharacterized protein YndB with AHSA1/START domain